MSTPSQRQPGDWQQPPQGWQQQPQGPPPGQYGPPPGQQGPQGPQYGPPPPGWTPPGASPYGGEPPKRKRRKWPWVLLGLLVFLFGGCAVLLSSVGGDPAPGGSVNGEAADPGANNPAGLTFAGQQEGDTVAEAGQSITLDDVVTTATPLVEGQAVGTTPVLCSTVTIANNGDDAAAFNGGFDWKLQDPQGAARSTTLGGSDTLLSAGELAPGGTVTGDVCFDNPTGAPGQYAVINEPAFSFSGNRAVWVQTR